MSNSIANEDEVKILAKILAKEIPQIAEKFIADTHLA